jgi:hypothetical protein
MGRDVRGAKCPWGELSLGRNVRGAKCLWGEMSVGRIVRGANCPWGEMSVGRVVRGVRCRGASCRGASSDGASCPWGELSWGEWSGNHPHRCLSLGLLTVRKPSRSASHPVHRIAPQRTFTCFREAKSKLVDLSLTQGSLKNSLEGVV